MLSFFYDYQYALGLCFLLQFTLFVPFLPPPSPSKAMFTPPRIACLPPRRASVLTQEQCWRRDFCDGCQRWSVTYRITVHTKLSCIACVQTPPPPLRKNRFFPREGGAGVCTRANPVWCEQSLRRVVTRSSPERCALRDDTKNDLLAGVAKFE